jgi:hypothetical protein
MTRRIGSVASVSGSSCFKFSADGERSCKPINKSVHTQIYSLVLLQTIFGTKELPQT